MEIGTNFQQNQTICIELSSLKSINSSIECIYSREDQMLDTQTTVLSVYIVEKTRC